VGEERFDVKLLRLGGVTSDGLSAKRLEREQDWAVCLSIKVSLTLAMLDGLASQSRSSILGQHTQHIRQIIKPER
jgi:hypothetical protein